MLHPVMPDLNALVALFYADPQRLGRFHQVMAEQMPADYRTLLAHEAHMTVTVEAFHECRVDVQVIDRRTDGSQYSRKILLTRQRDARVVQFGIMRIDFRYLEAEVQSEIEREATPLGRILIEHNVLRRVRLASLWQVSPGEDLQALFQVEQPRLTFGRTAMIECNGEPAVELLEIVAPLGV
jgi:chorismate-pyruvate lyase